MNSPILSILLAGLACTISTGAQELRTATPASSIEALRLVKTFALPKVGPEIFDHFAIDIKRNRLFATTEEEKIVLVMDAVTGEVLSQIKGLQRPMPSFILPI